MSYAGKTLTQFQNYVKYDLGPNHFKNVNDDKINVIIYFKVLMLIGDFPTVSNY
jgi:hypothetical protein